MGLHICAETVWRRATKFGVITQKWEKRVSRVSATALYEGSGPPHTGEDFHGVSHAPILRGGAPAYTNLGTYYMRAHSMRDNNHILHGDQTRCEEKVYRVDSKC